MSKVKIENCSDVVRVLGWLFHNAAHDVAADHGVAGLKTLRVSEFRSNPEKTAKLLVQLRATYGGMRFGSGTGKATFGEYFGKDGFEIPALRAVIGGSREAMVEIYGLLQEAWDAGVTYGESNIPSEMDDLASLFLEEDAA